MNVVLWTIAILLAVAFAGAGAMKLMQPKAKLAATNGMGWANDFSAGTIKAIGALEVAAAVGLVFPPLLSIAEWLAPLAALGLVAVMVGAIMTHRRRKEPFVVPAVLGAPALVVAVLRFGPYSF